MSRLYSWFLDIPVHRKLVLVYLFGIFLPLFLSSLYFTGNQLASAGRQDETQLKNSVEHLVSSLERHLEPINLVSRAIMADSAMYRLLLKEYANPGEYFEAHVNFLKPMLYKYTAGFRGLAQILVYVNNETIGTSAAYLNLNEDNRQSVWYQLLNARNHDAMVLKYRENDSRTRYSETEYLSLFRRLINPAIGGPYEMILRMDIQVNELLAIFEGTKLHGRLEIEDLMGSTVLSWSGGDADSWRGPGLTVERELRFPDRLLLKGTAYSSGAMVSDGIKVPGFVAISIFCFMLSVLFVILLSMSVTSRIHLLSAHLRRVEEQGFRQIEVANPGRDEIGNLLNDINSMANRIDFLINQVYRSKIKQKELMLAQKQAELNSLQSQINPHFLHNVLESIRMRALLNGEKETAGIMLKLSRLFRRMLSWDSDLISVEEELGATQEYLEIQHYRFNKQLEFEVDAPSSIMKRMIPKMTIQGFVENACIHGIEQKLGPGRVEIKVQEMEDALEIRISDNGVGFNTGVVPRGIGIMNILERLRLHYRDAASVTVESEPGSGTMVHILLPSRKEVMHVYPDIRR